MIIIYYNNISLTELPHDIWLIIYTVPPGSLLLALFFFNFVAITVWIVYCYRRKEKDGSYSTVKVRLFLTIYSLMS